MSKSMTMSSLRSKPSPRPWLPLPYMKKAVKFLLEHGAGALFLDPGLRKTSITLAAFCFLKKRGVATRMLVIAPLKACQRVWPAEVSKWKDFAHLRVVILHGPKKEERLHEDADVFVINPEGIEWLIPPKGTTRDLRRLKVLDADTLVIDELTKFKNPKGVRFKALKAALGTFARRWGLTGSPAPNGYLDLFGQCYVLDMGNALGQYITHYRLNYFINPDGQGWNWKLQEGAEKRIHARLKPLALRMDADDYLQLPRIVDVPVALELPADARRIYDAMEDDMVAMLDDGTRAAAANAAAVGGKLWQICNGGLYVDDDVAALVKGAKGRKTLVIHEEKTDWLEELVDELQGQPLLVAYQFQHDLDRLLERFSKEAPYFSNDDTKNAKIERAWNANELPFVFGQQDSIAHALNLQEGNAAHFAHYSLTWNRETFDQVLRRIRRSGNEAKRVFRYLPYIKDSTDEDRMYAISYKGKVQDGLNKALKARRSGKPLLNPWTSV